MMFTQKRKPSIAIGVSKLTLLLCFALLFQTLQSDKLAAEEPNHADKIQFNVHIQPILNRHCTACHGGVKQAADISFVYRDQVVAPEGWIVEPGEPDDSLLMERILTDDADEKMPPPDHGAGLSEDEVELVRQWIKQGAKWSNHWAFEKPLPQTLPETKDKAWARQPIDHFVLAKLEANDIKPAAEAEPVRWLRRATLDLTGLPPTLEERDQFLEALAACENAEQKEQAYADVADRLLASDSYGERWASVWLDQVRYADSKGLGLDGPRTIWKYRDWVIDAYNRDLPFDEFTVKQIAGDLLPDPQIEDYIATAAHRLTQTNEEGGTDDEEFRIAAVLDRTNTTWQAWQGVTFGCVQCHSHPYDPIRHEEYYKFAAFFNNTADSDLGEDWPTINAPNNTKDYDKASELDLKIAELKQSVWEPQFSVVESKADWKAVVDLQAKTSNQTQVTVESKADHAEFHTVDTVSKGTDITLTAALPQGLSNITAIRFTAMPLNPKSALQDSEWGFILSHVMAHWIVPGKKDPVAIKIERLIGDEADPFHNPNDSLSEKSKNGFGAYTRIYRPRTAALVLESATDIPENAKLQIVLKHRGEALGAFPLVTKRGHLAVTDSDEFAKLASDETLKTNRRELAATKKRRGAIKSTSVPVLKERPASLARSQQVFIRGLYLTKGDTVTGDTPAAFNSLPEDSQKSRLDLANWMVGPDNPLTARVAVNRFWARLFGNGLVATEEDFGSSGEMPSNQSLLDFLALQFQNEFGWSQKKLLRQLVLSSTYRQSSAIRPELQEQDSANRMLARGPRNRLSSEVVRDQALAIAGLLSDKKFGPPVRPPLPDGVWKPFASWDKWTTPDTNSEDRYRRAIYTYTKRSIPYPMFAAFDAPSREVCTPRRLPSNTPIQALMTLNDQTMIECAEAFAKRMQSFDGDINEQIRKGFLLATCREPESEEIETSVNLLAAYDDDSKAEGWNALASVFLNLDEVLTK
ncbi:PSD1 and planctomycete cytochrome C domain-containing protein [Mariniblastus fucicola]|uniref:Planctomycete cytochrome C n=1 Tax=Mariniblastus fucicola TaxID=980251 RepID=A0A5B9P1M5_9BACT|nr:PSD1 and planctomycete cytochrome C domain-containing protein [Mariniblastus fucicola]QEG20218.1 Planctomycete cytochrome C [Mariniblastus fucicola]